MAWSNITHATFGVCPHLQTATGETSAARSTVSKSGVSNRFCKQVRGRISGQPDGRLWHISLERPDVGFHVCRDPALVMHMTHE